MANLLLILFLIPSVCAYWLLPGSRPKHVILLVTSLAFVGLLDHRALALIAVLTILVYALGRLIAGSGERAGAGNPGREDGRHGGTGSSIGLWIGVLALVAVLFLFKYDRRLDGLLSLGLPRLWSPAGWSGERWIVPLGLSYLTLKYISYLVDVDKRVCPPGSLLEVFLYGTLFSIVLAGPLERFGRFREQLHGRTPAFEWDHLERGGERIIIGLFKKLVIADWIGYALTPRWQDLLFERPFLCLANLFAFGIWIYADFSAYSDIAIGASRMYGLTIMENFSRPYLKPNISLFWRSWHISLSDWIRDYVFFPLAQMSRSKVYLVVCVPILAMLACGLWHGATWGFAAWGIWHGAGISGHQAWNLAKRRDRRLASLATRPWFHWASVTLTYVFVNLGWWFFR